MLKQIVKLVEVKSIKRYPYQGKYHFNINKVMDDWHNFMFFDIERVRRDGVPAKWQPKPLQQTFKTEEDAEKAIKIWAKNPLIWSKRQDS